MPDTPPVSTVTPADIQMFLVDRSAADNELLDAPEFSAEQLASAIRLCVDKYRTTTPLVGPAYDVHTFPYRYELIIGTTGLLLQMAAFNLTRNRLSFTTREGTAVDDKARADAYVKLGKDLGAEFDARIKALKVHQNLGEAFGGTGSEYLLTDGFGGYA